MAAAMPQNVGRPAANRHINRQQLAQAVLSPIIGEFEHFASMKKLFKEDFGFDAFKIGDGLDVNIKLPASLQVKLLILHILNLWCVKYYALSFYRT